MKTVVKHASYPAYAFSAALVAAGHPGPSAVSSMTAATISDAAPTAKADTAPSLVTRAEIVLDEGGTPQT